MRKKIRDALDRGLLDRLSCDWPTVSRLNPKTDQFNGLFGYYLLTKDELSYFLTITPSESADSFRVNVAWDRGHRYPEMPFCDLHASIEQYLREQSAEIQLAQLTHGAVPFEFQLDPAATEALGVRDRIAQRIAKGETVGTDEWLATLSAKPTGIEIVIQEVKKNVEIIGDALRNHFAVR